MEDLRTIARAIGLLLVSRHLERVADHATNIAEMVVFLVDGKNIRHTGQPHAPAPSAPEWLQRGRSVDAAGVAFSSDGKGRGAATGFSKDATLNVLVLVAQIESPVILEHPGPQLPHEVDSGRV
jgi:hypothetical protein